MPHRNPHLPAPAQRTASEILMAVNEGGNAVLNVYDASGRRIETVTGQRAELRAHAAKYHPGLAIKQISA